LELLDAAHIVPDIEPQGLPLLPNGIALCKLHHAASDAFMLGITPDYRVEVRTDILDETDGPMLQHGMKDLHKVKIVLPRDKVAWPDRDLLDWRYQKFQSASGSL
jgi:putative restriction endonuclease